MTESPQTAPARPGSWTTYRRLVGYALPHWKLFLFSSLAMAVFAATDTGFAALMKPMLDDSFVGKDPDAIRTIPLLLIGLFLVRGITGFISSYGMNWVGRQVIQKLRGEMFARLLTLPNRYYDTHPTGQLVAKLIYNVEQVAQASTNAITILIRDSLTVVFLIAWMFYISGWLALLPEVVVQDELRQGVLVSVGRSTLLQERFYATTTLQRHQIQRLEALLAGQPAAASAPAR